MDPGELPTNNRGAKYIQNIILPPKLAFPNLDNTDENFPLPKDPADFGIRFQYKMPYFFLIV